MADKVRFARLINERLKALDRSAAWLTREVGESEANVSGMTAEGQAVGCRRKTTSRSVVVLFFGVVIIWLAAWGSIQAQQITVTPPPPTAIAAVGPTVTPAMAIEVRQPPQAPQGFWEKYGIIALLISGVIGGLLTLLFTNLLGPTFQGWGERLKERLKGETGRFLDRYVPALAEEHRYLKLVGIYGKESVTRPPLRDVYVTLHMGSAQVENGASQGSALTVAQALTSHAKLLILGEPGSGKSTLMDWLVLVFCNEVEQRALRALGDLLPIYLPLRSCAGDERPLDELMADPGLLPLSGMAPHGFFRDRLENGACLVLLDGLDEVVDHQARDRVVEKINRLVRTFSRSRYVVTCRTAGWEEGLLTGDFARLSIRDFSEADTHRFIAGWYRAVRVQQALGLLGLTTEGRQRELARAEKRAAEESQDLIDTLAAKPSLDALARNPLILSLIALVHYRRRDLPHGRTKLYQECLEILLEVWDKEDKELDVKGLSLNAKETILRQIAYRFHSQGITEARGDELKQLIAPLLSGLDCTLPPAEVLRQIEVRSGILVTRALDLYAFAHRTLQEYLTAQVLAASPNRYGDLLLHVREEPWREVILLYVGLIEDATPLVKAILAQPDDAQCNGLFLAGQCLMEDIRVAEEVRRETIGALERAFFETTDAVALERLGQTLAAIGGRDVVEIFARVLRDGSSAQQVGAARALGHLGARMTEPTAVIGLLTSHLSAIEAPVRRAAALALADLGREGEIVVTALERARRDEDNDVRAAALWALLELGQAERLSMVRVTAGEFEMGSDDDDSVAKDSEKPRHRIYLDTYYIGRYPVTNADFARFVSETGYKEAVSWQRFAIRGRENHPVVYVLWRDAVAYAAWMGATLPTEAEWEKAASWDNDLGQKRRWPWGDTFDRRLCNSEESHSGARALVANLLDRLPGRRKMPSTTPVGAFSPGGDSPCGAADMAGNVWEWCNTAYAKYPYDPDDGREDSAKGEYRILRGGSWYNDRNAVRCAYRYGNLPVDRIGIFGFRVARGSLR